MRFQLWLDAIGTPWVTVCVAVALALVAAGDRLTGPDLLFSAFYIIPVSIAAWHGRTWLLVATCVAASLTWEVADRPFPPNGPYHWVDVWDTSVLLGYFLFTAFFLTTTRRLLDRASELALLDPLTGVMNLRAFRDQGDKLLLLMHRLDQPATLAFLDVDDFKRINDTYGHAAGDILLRAVAHSLRETLRRTDMVARIGGDEFVVLLPDTDEKAAVVALEKARAAMMAATAAGHGAEVSFSVGAATIGGTAGSQKLVTIDEALQAADQLMYRVKKSGKNALTVERAVRTDSPSVSRR